MDEFWTTTAEHRKMSPDDAHISPGEIWRRSTTTKTKTKTRIIVTTTTTRLLLLLLLLLLFNRSIFRDRCKLGRSDEGMPQASSERDHPLCRQHHQSYQISFRLSIPDPNPNLNPNTNPNPNPKSNKIICSRKRHRN